MQHYQKILILVVTFASGPIYAQHVQSEMAMGTDGIEPSVFNLNPAMVEADKFSLGYAQYTHKNTHETEYILNDSLSGDAKFDIKESAQAVGLIAPLGGGFALGVTGEQVDRQMAGDFSLASRVIDESYETTYGAGKVVIQIVDKVQGAFTMRYAQIKNEIYGRFWLREEDFTKYKGTMSGYSAGVWYRDQDYGLGAAYYSTLRGKAKIGVEEKIITAPGEMLVNLHYGRGNDWHFGSIARRFIYKKDDRSTEYTSPIDERDISLNGSDMEQFMFTTQELHFALDTPLLFHQIYLRLNLAKIDAVFMTEEDQIVGDDSDDEEDVESYQAKAAIAFGQEPFFAQLGYRYSIREESKLNDNDWFSREYRDYKATESTIFVHINYMQ